MSLTLPEAAAVVPAPSVAAAEAVVLSLPRSSRRRKAGFLSFTFTFAVTPASIEKLAFPAALVFGPCR